MKYLWHNRSRIFAKHQRGAELVEVAMTLGYFLLLVLSAIEMAMYVYHFAATGYLAKEGLRYAIVRGNEADADTSRTDVPATEASIGSYVSSIGLLSPVMVLACWPGDANDPATSCSGSSPALDPGGNNLPGMPINITVSYDYQTFFVPEWFGLGRTISSTAHGTILF